MSVSRRQFLQYGSATATTMMIPSVLQAQRAQYLKHANAIARVQEKMPRADDPATKALLERAIEAARAGGATYADARYKTTLFEGHGWQMINFDPFWGYYEGGVGVRALYNGYWGYAALMGDTLSADSAARLGREAIGQAKIGAKGKPRVVDLAPTPVVNNGTWITPIEIDPFTITWDEKIDTMNGIIDYFDVQPFSAQFQCGLDFRRDTQTFASSEGSSYTQTLYRTKVSGFSILGHWRSRKPGARHVDNFVSMASAGWEYALKAPLELEARRMMAQSTDNALSASVDVGRYDIVFDGASVARLADMHLGAATELDRAMGYLANDEGTSYLNDPVAMLGSQVVASPLVTLTANRSMPGGVATVKWDAEGVEPDEAVLVKDGILTDFQTTRESASWLAPYYQKIGKPVRSHGGALCTSARFGVQQGPHNLVLHPSVQDTSFEELCAGVKKGLAVFSNTGRVDQQALNGESQGDVVYEINNGKLGRAVDSGVFISRGPELWKNVIALGGARTVCPLGIDQRNDAGEARHTVSAPAALVKQVAVTTNLVRDI